jgi:hypothetical protein
MATHALAVWGPVLSKLQAVALVVMGSLVAQAPFEVVAVPGRVEARVDGQPGHIAVLFLAFSPGTTPLPGGHSLALESPVLAGASVVDARGIASFGVAFPVGALAGLTILAEAVLWNPTLPLDMADALQVSEVRKATVPVVGKVADVFVLFGQSNAEGAGDGSTLPPRLLGPRPHARIWSDPLGQFQAMEHGVNTRSYGLAGWCGPELTLAADLAGHDRTVYLVKFAWPATALGFTPGPWNEWGAPAQELYAIMQFRLASACAALRVQGLEPRVRGIFMMQGESDALQLGLATAYRQNLEQLIGTFRLDLLRAGLVAAPEVPFVLGGLPDLHAGFTFAAQVRAAQASVVAALPRCAMIETRRFTMLADRVHFDAAGCLRLGAEFAAAWHALAGFD